jgi:hypothetical protein
MKRLSMLCSDEAAHPSLLLATKGISDEGAKKHETILTPGK